ncbi:MAG: RNA polymerase sigma factor [Planctomycetes bacterium]|nr:RNA polymerase sigma factor [Planctomycetota bacterium]NBY01959.1 RNA polymerase sigma factor [Planctomycetota bacterium]
MNRPGITEDGSAPLKLDNNQSNGERLLATFNEIRDELTSSLWFILGNKDDAHDIAQDAFLRCWKKQDALPDVLNLKAWIFKVAINAAKDLRKSAWKRKTRTMPEEDVMMYKTAVSPLESLQENEMVEQLRAALMSLRPEEKEVFLLRQNADMTYEQIAESANRPIGTIKTQMRSALQKLKVALS